MQLTLFKVQDWSDFIDTQNPGATTKNDNNHLNFISETTPLCVYIYGSVFAYTTTTGRGGAVQFTSLLEGARFLAESCFFSGCRSTDNGGALYAKVGSIGIFSKLCFTNCSINSPNKKVGQYACIFVSSKRLEDRNEIYMVSCIKIKSTNNVQVSLSQWSGKIINKEHNISQTEMSKYAGMECVASSTASHTLLNYENLTCGFNINTFSDDGAKDFEMNITLCNCIRCKPNHEVGLYDNFATILLEGSISISDSCFVYNLDRLFFQKYSKENNTKSNCTSTVTNCVIIGDYDTQDKIWGASEGSFINIEGAKQQEFTNKIVCYKTADCEAKYNSYPDSKEEKQTLKLNRFRFLFLYVFFVSFIV